MLREVRPRGVYLCTHGAIQKASWKGGPGPRHG